jgi:hypothetical protein
MATTEEITAMDATATRRQHGKATKVHLTFPDGGTHIVGGNRAARCQFAIVVESNEEHWTGRGWGFFGLRSDRVAAEREAAKIACFKRIDQAFVVPITDEEVTA